MHPSSHSSMLLLHFLETYKRFWGEEEEVERVIWEVVIFFFLSFFFWSATI